MKIAKGIIQLILVLIILILGMTSCSNKVVAIIDGDKIERERDIQKKIEYYQKVDHAKEVKVQPWMLSKGN